MPSKLSNGAEMRLYTDDHERLYLNASERQAFIKAALNGPPLVRLFCLTLVFTGCRHSEARFLRRSDLQLGDEIMSIRTLKRRKTGMTREVPIPKILVEEISKVHFGQLQQGQGWLFSDGSRPPPRSATYRWIKHIMQEAGIAGPQACPKGLRHGYGVHATKVGVQLHMLQKWMGHASMETTAIYATALGRDELEVAKRMW